MATLPFGRIEKMSLSGGLAIATLRKTDLLDPAAITTFDDETITVEGTEYGLDLDPRFAARFVDAAAQAYLLRQSVFLSTKKGKVSAVWRSTTDRVVRIVELAGSGKKAKPDLEITFETSHATRTLLHGHPAYNTIRDSVRRAAAEQRFVSFASRPSSMELIDLAVLDSDLAKDDPIAMRSRAFIGAPDPFASVKFDPISEVQVAKAFKDLARYTHMPFDYPNDCCHTRAHQMCGLLAERGIGTAKWWHFTPPDVLDKDENVLVDYRIRVNTPQHVDGKTKLVEWGWHVAPVVRVTTKAGIKRRIIDPSMFDKPVSIPTWLAAQPVFVKRRKTAKEKFGAWKKSSVASSDRQEVPAVFFTSRGSLDASGKYVQSDTKKLADPDFLESHIRLGIHLFNRNLLHDGLGD